MENVDWNAIFEIAKKHLKGGAKNKLQVSIKKVKGGVQKYKCPWGDYNPPRPLKAEFTMHIITAHGPELKERFPTMTDKQLERIAAEAASELKFRSDVAGSEPTKKRAQESFGKIVSDIVGPVAPTDEKTDEPVEAKESEEEKKFKKLLEEEETKKAKAKKEADWMSEIKKAEKPPAGVPDIAKMLSKEIEPKGEEDPYVKLAKDTVKNIKKKEKTNPAAQAGKKALSKARKTMEDSKIEPVPAPIGIKVVKKGTRTKKLKAITKPNDGRTVPSKATRGIGLLI